MAEKTTGKTTEKTSKQAAKRKAAEARVTEQAAKTVKENIYEAMFLLGPSGATEPQAALDLCRGFIERHGGKIKVLKKWDVEDELLTVLESETSETPSDLSS